MPEGHSVHRIARQFAASFEGAPVQVTSPQGRFAAEATRIDGHRIVAARSEMCVPVCQYSFGLSPAFFEA